VDRNASSNNLPEDLVIETSFAQLLRIVRLDLPPSSELYHPEAETVLLAHIRSCNASRNEDDIWEYTTMGRSHFIDLNSIQCSVGRIHDRGKWTFIDRSAPTAHIEIASPATESQSSITDPSTFDSFGSDSSSSEGSAQMSGGSLSLRVPYHDEDAMSTSSLSDDV
jgi:hypothetical protein